MMTVYEATNAPLNPPKPRAVAPKPPKLEREGAEKENFPPPKLTRGAVMLSLAMAKFGRAEIRLLRLPTYSLVIGE